VKARAAVCYVERHDGKLLCVWNKRYGKWGWPGGKVEKGELVEQAALRELREETGCSGTIRKFLYSGEHGESVESSRGSTVYVFETEIDPVFFSPEEQEEGCAVTWLSREEFLKWGIAPAFYTRMFSELKL
jgi:8-oxo-dGTP diphosphatase